MSTRDFQKEAMSSEFAYRIVKLILDLDEENAYPSKIAEKLDSHQQTVGNYLSGLIEKGIVVKGDKKGRKQPYLVSEKGLLDLWHESWNKIIDDFRDQDRTQQYFDQKNVETGNLDDIKDTIGDRLYFYPMFFFNHYLESVEKSTIQKMLIDDYVSSLIYWKLYGEEPATEFADISDEIIEVMNYNYNMVVPAYLSVNNGVSVLQQTFEDLQKIVEMSLDQD